MKMHRRVTRLQQRQASHSWGDAHVRMIGDIDATPRERERAPGSGSYNYLPREGNRMPAISFDRLVAHIP